MVLTSLRETPVESVPILSLWRAVNNNLGEILFNLELINLGTCIGSNKCSNKKLVVEIRKVSLLHSHA
jgi:hypothetical protein